MFRRFKPRLLPVALIAATLALGLGCAPAANSDLPKVGFFQFNSTTSLDALRDGFLEGLQEGGFEDGKTMALVQQNAQSDTATLNLIAQQFSTEVDLVGLCSTQALQAAVRAVKDKPIVFSGVIDPVAAGAAKSLTEPLPNVTGVYNPFPVTQGMQMITQIMPDVKRIGTLYDPSEPFFNQMREEAEAEAEKLGVEFVQVSITSSAEITTGMQALKARGVQAVLQLPSNTVNQGVEGQVKAALSAGMPIFSLQPDQVPKGVIAAVGIDLRKAGREAGLMAAEILKGKKPSDLPLQKATTLPVTASAENAQRFGVTLPADLK